MPVTLKHLLGISLDAIQPDAASVGLLLAAAQRNIADAQLAGLSAENRFDAAYKATMQLAMVALQAELSDYSGDLIADAMAAECLASARAAQAPSASLRGVAGAGSDCFDRLCRRLLDEGCSAADVRRAAFDADLDDKKAFESLVLTSPLDATSCCPDERRPCTPRQSARVVASFVPGAAVVAAVAASARWMALRRPAWPVDQATDLEARRAAKGPVTLH